jgi:hypothetical protein
MTDRYTITAAGHVLDRETDRNVGFVFAPQGVPGAGGGQRFYRLDQLDGVSSVKASELAKGVLIGRRSLDKIVG